MGKSKCVPLEITAHLADGRFCSADGILMFDSILYHAWFLKHKPEVFEDGYEKEDIGHVGLPLRQLPGNRWAASKGVYEVISQEIEHFNKRPDFFHSDKIGYLNEKSGIIDDKAGKFRAYRMPQLIRTVKNGEIKFYAIGHIKEIEELLQLMVAVGKKPSIGYGIVKCWSVSKIDEDYTTFHPKHGLMRPIEVEEAEKEYDCPVMCYAVKPPYWKEKNMRLCYVPI